MTHNLTVHFSHTFLQIIIDGYATHLEELKQPGFVRRANNNKIVLPRGNFGLCNFITGFCGIRLRKKHRAARQISYTLSNANSCVSTPRLSNKFGNSNRLDIRSSNSYKSISVNHSPTSNASSNMFTNFFHNRTSFNKLKSFAHFDRS